jgi:hypothetical protein
MVLGFRPSKDDVPSLIAKKNYTKAIEVIRQKLQTQKHDPRLKLQLADVLVSAGKGQQAIPVLEQLADEFAREGFAAKSISVLKKIQKIDPGRRDVNAKMAALIQEKQRHATASMPTAKPAAPGGFEFGMEEIGMEGAPGGGGPKPATAESSPGLDISFGAEPISAPAPAPAPPKPEPPSPPLEPPKPAPAPKPAPPAPPPKPEPAPVVDQDLIMGEAEESGLQLESEPLSLDQAAVAAPAPEPVPEPVPEPALEVQPEPEPVLELAPEPEPVAAPAPAAEPDLELAPEPEILPEPTLELAPEPEILPEPEMELVEEPVLELVPEAAAEPEILPELEPEPEPDVPDPMTDAAFADELMNVLEEAFPAGLEADEPAEAGAETGGAGSQIVVSPLFKELAVDEMVAVIQGLNLITFESASFIITEGEPGDSLYMLTTGSVKAFKKDPKTKRQVLLGELGEGSFFGEVSILTGKPRTATIVASTYCELLELDRATLDSIVKQHPRVLEVMREFAKERLARA